MSIFHPIMSCEESLEFEHRLLGDDVEKTWSAMNSAGRSLGAAVLRDFMEIAPFPQNASILVLCGKGHNAGDAILAADQILRNYPLAEVTLMFIFGEEVLRPLVTRAYENIVEVGKVKLCKVEDIDSLKDKVFDICIDGLLGMQFCPPFRDPLTSVVQTINRMDNIRLRAAVDLPSGVGEESVDEPFRADFTYATGIAKSPIFKPEHANFVGRVRYLDIGFFKNPAEDLPLTRSILQPKVLEPLQQLRRSFTDKRHYGHLYILGGSASMPGALLMSVQAALHAGTGLLTVFAPESIVASFSAQAPEAMWVPWPETPDGGLALEGLHLLRERINRCDALLMGPGMGREHETHQLVCDIISNFTEMPLVLDADALTLEAVERLKERPKKSPFALITPHAGEFERLSQLELAEQSDSDLMNFCKEHNIHMLLKGPVSRIYDAEKVGYSIYGGPVLARGGSGDILGGLIAGIISGNREKPFLSLSRGAVLHGIAADLMARDRGQTAVTTTDILKYLSPAIRSVI